MISTIIVRFKFTYKDSQTLEQWRKRIEKETGQAKGFLDKTELPSIGTENFHTVVLRFDSKINAEDWLNSDARKELLQHSAFIQFFEKEETVYDSNAFWFAQTTRKQGVKWKQWVISFFAVYPLSIIYSFVVNLILEKLGVEIGFFKGTMIALLMSFSMVYKVMPFLLKTFNDWIKR
jgi:antibiotic biosynthesis monooxygenase (ABM) superfamily enzyme